MCMRPDCECPEEPPSPLYECEECEGKGVIATGRFAFRCAHCNGRGEVADYFIRRTFDDLDFEDADGAMCDAH